MQCMKTNLRRSSINPSPAPNKTILMIQEPRHIENFIIVFACSRSSYAPWNVVQKVLDCRIDFRID